MATLAATQTIDVETPATGAVIRTLPVTSPADVQAMAERARAAQPGWEALGFEGRGRVLRRMQKWVVDNADRVVQTIVDETGKTYEDASIVELAYGAGALAAGNAVLLKPSEITPLTSLMLAEAFRECGMPENVLQIPIGGAETGTALIDEVDFVMFTGSTATGKKVMARAAETLTPVSLELGGK